MIFQTILCAGQPTCHGPINQERAKLIDELLKQRTDKNYNGSMPMVRLALHNITNHKFEVNVAPFGKGIYFVNVRTAKHFKTRKLVVE